MFEDVTKPRLYPVAVFFFFSGLFSPISSTWADTAIATAHVSPSSIKMEPGKPEDLPALLMDDLDKSSLIRVVENQLAAMKNISGSRPVKVGDQVLTYARFRETLSTFLSLLHQNLSPNEFDRQVREKFVFYSAGEGNQAFFTGYYTPVLKASRFQTEKYVYPLYQLPESLVVSTHSDTGDINRSFFQARNFTREDIDGRNVLANQNLEIAWLENDIERFFLHIQGSGLLKYENGTTEGVQYTGSNGYSYQAIGKLMARDGVISDLSMQGIKSYLRARPEDVPRYFYQNQRYVFFKLTDYLPRGSGGGELVPHRSIATDKSFYPAGGLVFIVGKKPVLDDKNEVTGWEEFSRFVVDQDTGASIKGPGRVDLYFGLGEQAGAGAGRYAAHNKIFYLLGKD